MPKPCTEYHSRALCRYSKRFDNWNQSYRWTRFCAICCYNILYRDITYSNSPRMLTLRNLNQYTLGYDGRHTKTTTFQGIYRIRLVSVRRSGLVRTMGTCTHIHTRTHTHTYTHKLVMPWEIYVLVRICERRPNKLLWHFVIVDDISQSISYGTWKYDKSDKVMKWANRL